jgi:hypothetical protein
MAPRALRDDGGSAPLRKQEDVSKDLTATTPHEPGAKHLSGCHDGMYLGR